MNESNSDTETGSTPEAPAASDDWGALFDAPADAAESQPAQDGEAAAAPSDDFTVLCVDDEANILSSLKRLFRPTGYRLLTANSGEEALALMEKEAVDLIISDMRMPGLNGAQVLAASRERWPDTVRILLTGFADMASTIEAINNGQLHRYIAKPWDDNEVLLVVREGLEKKALLREKARLEALTQKQNEELKELNASLEQKVEARTAELAAANEKLKAGFINAIKTFSAVIELRGGKMAGHSRRVADLARRLAGLLKAPPAEVQNVFFAGLLHDIGKIGLPDRLLQKPYMTLAPGERHEVEKHPARATALLMGLDQMRDAAPMILAHHEHWDGSGYPNKVRGAAIPMGARVLAVVNDFDGMLNGTIYNREMTQNEALDMIAASRGKRYDPRVADAFVAMMRNPEKAEAPTPSGWVVRTADLKLGMALTKDLVTRDGVLLLAHDIMLDETLIQQIRDYEQAEGLSLELHVIMKSVRAVEAA